MKYTRYNNLQIAIYIKPPVDEQTRKIFAKNKNDEYNLKVLDYDKYIDQVKDDCPDVYEGIHSEFR